ncbi:MAG: hypothetical protein DI628_00865 [Blastochloris viridis]|uniref:Uncharacterized protein n=1 Tax=Blastochloris viridis TaxID=1079 RepID=A0A6N4RAW7_BLAVI|nr:MAG: hypothetical protein DI628_00865 [Blastochloris viridis]
MNIFTKFFSVFFRKQPESTVTFTGEDQFTCLTGNFKKCPDGQYLNLDNNRILSPLVFYASLVAKDRPFFEKPLYFHNDMSLELAENVQKQLDAIEDAKEDERRRKLILEDRKMPLGINQRPFSLRCEAPRSASFISLKIDEPHTITPNG